MGSTSGVDAFETDVVVSLLFTFRIKIFSFRLFLLRQFAL